MNEAKANALASLMGGEAWHSGGGLWLVLISLPDGKRVVFGEDSVCEYHSHESFVSGESPLQEIVLEVS